MNEPDTRGRLLTVALELIQTRGYNAFSFRDLAERVGVKTASVHYHFPTKGDLGRVLVGEHRRLVAGVRTELDAGVADPWERLRRFAGVFRATLENGHRMCLGGILATEYSTLPPELVAEVRGFYEDNERWLTGVLTAGRKAGVVRFAGSAADVARVLFSSLEGAMLAARAFADVGRLDAATVWLLDQLKVKA